MDGTRIDSYTLRYSNPESNGSEEVTPQSPEIVSRSIPTSVKLGTYFLSGSYPFSELQFSLPQNNLEAKYTFKPSLTSDFDYLILS